MEDLPDNTPVLQGRPDETQHKNVEIQAKHAGGRPSTITAEVLVKLEQAFAIDATVEEALSYAEIKRDAYYDYLKRNPEFADRVKDLRNRPILKARQTIVKNLDDPEHSKWYLSRKRKAEFAERFENTGADGAQIVFMPPTLMEKYGLTNGLSPEPKLSSGGQAQIPGSELRPEMGQDDTRSMGDVRQSSPEERA